MRNMNKVVGFAGTKAVLALVAVVLMAQYSHIIYLRFTALKPLGADTYRVTGKVRLRRTDNYLEWMGPSHLPSFESWWQSTGGINFVDDYTNGLIELLSIDWDIIKSYKKSDILEFTATFKLDLPSGPGKTPKNLLQIVKSLP
jgi:hypothetical protein